MTAPKLLLVMALLIGITGCADKPQAVWTDYTPQAFAKAQAENKTILAHVWAVWCVTCKAQQPTLDALQGDAAAKNAVFFRIDFDKEKDFLATYKVPVQSTVIVFKGAVETGRVVAETDKGKLRDFALSALKKSAA